MGNQNDEPRTLGGQLSAFFRERERARTADVPRPACLDEAAPTDPALVRGWRDRREQSSKEYAAALLNKQNLTPEEWNFLTGELAKYARGE